jgi:hypothetical protein
VVPEFLSWLSVSEEPRSPWAGESQQGQVPLQRTRQGRMPLVNSGLARASASCKEMERHVNMGLMCNFTAPIRAHCFSSLVVISRGYKASGCPCKNLHPLTRTPVASSSPYLCMKRERGRESVTVFCTGKIQGGQDHTFLF